MTERLTQDQFVKLVAEVEKLSRQREAELDREQVKQILQELNLPTDLVDDALVQVRRREALLIEQRRNRWTIGGVIAVLVVSIALTTLYFQQQKNTLAQVSAYQSRITLAQDNGSNLIEISRQTNPQVYYRVTLNNAPVGEKLSLTCDWIDPSGQIAHQSHYQTREIDRVVWPTNCFYQFNPAAAPGIWKVQMSLDGHILSTTAFGVK